MNSLGSRIRSIQSASRQLSSLPGSCEFRGRVIDLPVASSSRRIFSTVLESSHVISRSNFHPGAVNSIRHRSSTPISSEMPRFSKSAAFQGHNRGTGVAGPPLKFDYYSTEEFTNKKLISAVLSLTALIIYFGWLREPSDLDEILNAPPHLLTANLERKMLRDQIEKARANKEDTELLQAQLEYVDVKEAALKIQFEKKK